jgi:hypothetical protein
MVKKKKEIFRTLKTTLHTVVKKPEHTIKINNIVITINNLRCHTLQFSKLYLLHLFIEKIEFPVINREYFQCIIRTLTYSVNKRREFTSSKVMYESINSFFILHYKELIHEQNINITGLQSVVRYMITDIITDYENNIKMRFYNHLKNYINSIYNKDLYINMIRKLEKNKDIRKKLINIKTKHINKTIKCLYEFSIHSWLNIEYTNILPIKTFKKDSVFYDIQCNPQDYIKNMIFMNTFCEYNGTKTLNVFPLKRSIIPGHIRIDTKTIIENFTVENKKLYRSTGSIELFKDVIWNEIFKTDKQIFNGKKYKFHGSIQTDGFSISILQSSIQDNCVKENESKELYIDELSKLVIKTNNLLKKKSVCIDPNKDDLIYCGSGSKENDDFITFRYTNNQRSKETRKRKHRKILLHEKELLPIVAEKELELSVFNSKTNNIELFKAYIKIKNENNISLKVFYERVLWRKLRLSTYTRTQKSEMTMINRFKEKFGNPEEAFIGFGDWSQKEQMKYKEPTKGKSFRSLFRKAGYQVFLIDEFRTSKKCCNCKNENKNDGICETFLKIKSPRPWKRDTDIICNGLVKCKTCYTMFNRDVNSVVNMLEITKAALNKNPRPKYLMRDLSLLVKASNKLEADGDK